MYKNFLKRFFDIFCSLSVFLFLWPLYFLLMILVRIKLGKPVYFRQVRPGKDGKLFVMYKFRSMTNKTDDSGKLLPDSKRLTKFGKFLRSTSLDEMPEAINILKGEMSVIGPRPLLVKDYVFFDEKILKRQSVKPGLSGLAQISGRNNISWEDKFRLDLEYIEKVSFAKDASLVFKTIFKAFVKHDNVSREGYSTDIDYGDYLLLNKQISDEIYSEKLKISERLLNNFYDDINKRI